MSKMIIVEGNSNDKDNVRVFMVKGEKGEQGDLNHNDIVNNLDSSATNKVLSAKQGKVLKDLVDKKAYYYNSVANMKADTTLQNGDMAITLGYYTANDGGSGKYIIRTKTNNDTINDMDIIGLNNANLIAEIIVDNFIDAKQFGAYGDGTHDDTDKIQECLDKFTNVYISSGIYMIDASKPLKPKSNTILVLDKDTILKCITNNLESYNIIKIDNIDNLIIEGGTIEGDKETHTGSSGEWGQCISIINNSSNITIRDIKLSNAWGDGLYINTAKNITTENIICENNRRQGLSIISVEGYHSLNDKFILTSGTAPGAGVDIEPNYENDKLSDIVFDSPFTASNENAGIKIHLYHISNPVNISINNHCDELSANALAISKDNSINGGIFINNSKYLNNTYAGINLRDCYNGNCHVFINNPFIENCNTSDLSASYSCGIGMYTTLTSNKNLGGVTIKDFYITLHDKTTALKNAIYMSDTANNSNKIENIKIFNPLNRQSNLRINLGKADYVDFIDTYKLYSYDENYTLPVNNNRIYSLITNETYTSSRTLTISESECAIGTQITFLRTNAICSLGFKLPDSNYCKYFGASGGLTITLANDGDSVTIKKINQTNWIVTNIVGTPTIS